MILQTLRIGGAVMAWAEVEGNQGLAEEMNLPLKKIRMIRRAVKAYQSPSQSREDNDLAKMGEILKSLLLKNSRDIAVATTAPIVVAERVTDLGGLVALAAIGCLAFDAGVSMAIGGGVLVLLLSVICSVRPVGLLLVRFAGRLPVLHKVADRLHAAYDALHRLSGFRTVVQATLLSTLAWFTHCVCLWHCAEGIAPGSIDLLASCVAYAVPLLGGTLLLIPGGLGATEASMTGLLVVLSGSQIGTAAAAAITLLVRLVTFWWAIGLGLAALGWWHRRYRRTDR